MSRTRGTWNTKGVWAAGGALAIVLALTGYMALSGSDDDAAPEGKGERPSASAPASAAPTYTVPSNWTEPDRWAALPRGQRTDKYGSQVGFPHSTEGGVGMLVAAQTFDVSGQKSVVDEHLRVYYSYLAPADHSEAAAERVELRAGEEDKELHRQMGVRPGGPLPSGAYMRSTVVGYKVISQSSDEVSIWLLNRVTQKAGETDKENVVYTRSLAAAIWDTSDWKLSAKAAAEAKQAAEQGKKPEGAAPGDKKFNAAGWTAIRQAS